MIRQKANVNNMAKEIPAIVKDRLLYNPLTGDLIWIFKNKKHPRLHGNLAGCIRDGRVVIKINGTPYFAHRLAWFLFYGEQPNVIDHINGNSTDNRIENLRNVTESENAKNHGKKLNNSNLPCGVRMLPSKKFQARITCNKNVFHIGIFETPELAELAYLEKRKSLFKEYSRKAA
jgi:hypothetical protein